MATCDIALPSAIKPAFPKRCVCCETENPDGAARISVTGASSGPSLKEAAIDAALGGSSRGGSNVRVTVLAPACPSCGKALERRHFWKTVMLYTGGLGGAAFLGFSLMLGFSIWVGLLGIAIGVLGPVIYELKHPPAFTFTPAGARTIYEFRSEKYAADFAALNGLGEVT